MMEQPKIGSETGKVTPVILSGGGGTRLWPMSTPDQPKQFLALTGELTMFQLTVQRVGDRTRFSAPIVVANAAHLPLVIAQLAELDIHDAILIMEPCARNTAPAIALAALAATESAAGPATPLLVMPSDHVIGAEHAFLGAAQKLLPLVEDGWLATFGIAPTGPETGYGYIQMGESLSESVHRVAQFVEKPDLARAQTMLESGEHLWNGGIFLFRADAFLGALSQFAPEMLTAAQNAMSSADRDGNHLFPNADAFAASPSDSIDYAVMEQADRVAVVPVTMGWSDVGSWDALFDLGGSSGETSSGKNVIAIDCSDSLFKTDGIRINAVGVKDLIVVVSGGEVLIVPRGMSQDVKKIVEARKAEAN
jgi:mannose-1-phosphate guanylyltransferase